MDAIFTQRWLEFLGQTKSKKEKEKEKEKEGTLRHMRNEGDGIVSFHLMMVRIDRVFFIWIRDIRGRVVDKYAQTRKWRQGQI
jgi:hypothetical protein